MRTLHLCTSASWGGLEVYACTLISVLSESGVEVTTVCAEGTKCHEFLVERNLSCIALPSPARPSIRSIMKLRRLVTERRVDVLHAHFHSDVSLAVLVRGGNPQSKVFVSVYMGVSEKKDILHRLMFDKVDGFFTSSKELLTKLSRVYPVPQEKIHYLPYGRELPMYQRDEERRKIIRAEMGIGEGEILVGSMLRIDPGKGVFDFVKSYKHLGAEARRKTAYVIIGEPTRRSRPRGARVYEPDCEDYRDAMLSWISEHGFRDKIHFVGYQTDAIGYLSALDVFVFPSHDELYSLVVLDAMAMKLPVVASNSGGNRDQIDHEKTGLLYNVKDAMDLAFQVERLVRSEDVREALGASARKFVDRNHDMNAMVKRLLELYRVAGTHVKDGDE